MCGGTLSRQPAGGSGQGLSPRVRGNRCGICGCPSSMRSIPACAGEPATGKARGRRRRVYPRVCGGTVATELGSNLSRGLSPRVRGNLRNILLNLDSQRSIPACAGEPIQLPRRIKLAEVYPRVCGGTRRVVHAGQHCRGLSPRVRGNPEGQAAGFQQGGSIPACAGEPPCPPPTDRLITVYPRVCGGT